MNPIRTMVLALGVLALGLLSACAAPFGGQKEARLDDLFSRLRSTASVEEAHSLEIAILHVWSNSGRPEADSLMLRGAAQANTGDLDGALATYDRVVGLVPDFAEAYDQRALVHAMRDEYDAALSDILHVLSIEPRHFGALSGLGHIMLMYGDDVAALHAFEAALSINPHLVELNAEVAELKEKMAGTEI